MLNQENVKLGKVRSSIRELFEYGKKRKAEIGEENVFDFSLGNPNVPAPEEVKTALADIIAHTDPIALHGYTSATGAYEVRKVISDYINSRFDAGLDPDCIYMTCGAAASLTITLNALVNTGDEVIVFAPYFPEYKVFSSHAGAKLIAVESLDGTFQIDFGKLEAALSSKTKAVIINSPNNPSGVVYTKAAVEKLCRLLKEYSLKYGNPIYLISDEPYRELVYDGAEVPFIMNYYEESIVCYSYSKSLSLAGERIGYIAVNAKMPDSAEVYAGICGAGRALGLVCAPSLFQRLIQRVYDKTSDISIYKANRDLLCSALTEYGFTVVKPDGAFYLFVKAPKGDGAAFAGRAKKYELLLVDGKDFGCAGYVRISFCVATEMIKKSLSAFKALAESYNL